MKKEMKTCWESPCGWLEIRWTEEGITLVSRRDECSVEEFPPQGYGAELIAELKEYFAGRRSRFDVPLVVRGTLFQERVWEALCSIPYGETRSYQDIAEAVGNPKACRAVGMANNRNRIGIVIPCHRVIGKSGSLVGYGAGLEMKEFLLDLEKRLSPC